MLDRARIAVARRLERGTALGRSPVARAIADVANRAFARGLIRPLTVPAGARIVTVGGATLGGSGKTRVALSCARELARLGAEVALVGHAYGAAPGRARFVATDDDLAVVGDEALSCARALGELACVVVAPERQAAVNLAASRASVLVVDGPLQIGPARASLSLLAVDRDEPWGSGQTLPFWDLRAPRRALLAASDLLVPVDASPAAEATVAALAGRRFALFSATARPHRLRGALARLGLSPVAGVQVPDHGPADRAAAEVARLDAEIDLWLATDKCELHLRTLAPARPIAVLEPWTTLPPPVAGALAQLAAP